MKPGYVFWTVVSVGVLILVFGVVLHGVPRSPPTPESRQRMQHGTAIAVGGLALIALSVLVRKATNSGSSYEE